MLHMDWRNDSVNYTKLCVTEKQPLEIRIVLFFFPRDSDRIVLLLKQYYYLLLRADIEIKMM